MSERKRIVIVGATSAIAEHCARLWALENPSEFVLVGRNLTKLQKFAADLKVRSPESDITTHEADFHDPNKIQRFADDLFNKRAVDIALIAHGSLPDQAECQTNLELCRETLEVNGVSPVLFAEAFVKHMETHDKGTLAIIGSVAGDRGRKSNYVYGSAKGLVDRYAQGLQHRLAKTKVKVVLIKPGPTDTPMTASVKVGSVRLAGVREVSKDIVKGICEGKHIIYTPAKWSLIMMTIRHIPRAVFNHLNI